MSPTLSARNEAVLALGRLYIAGIITGYQTNFLSLDEPGVTPHVTVTIRAHDELAIERVRRAVQRALAPYINDLAVTVQPGLLPGGGPADSFHFGSEDEETP